MPSYTATVMGTVLVAVAGAEVSRLVNIKYNEDHPHLPEHDPKQPNRVQKRKVVTVMQPVLSGFALGLFLFAAGMISERLATLLCLLIAVSSLIWNGIPLFSILSNLTK